MASAAKKEEPKLLMPKATAVWLIDNTTLTFHQIAIFTNLTEIEIEALADGDIGKGLVGRNPVEHKEITQEELDRCIADDAAHLTMHRNDLPSVKSRAKGPRYTPVSKRGDKPDAIAFVLKQNPEITDAQLCKLIGTTKPTINNVRERTHPNMSTIKARHPAELGLCTYVEFDAAVEKGLRAQGKDPEAVKAQRMQEIQDSMDDGSDDAATGSSGGGGFDFSNFLGTDNSSGDDN